MSFDDVKFHLKKFGMSVYEHRADIAFFGGMGLTIFGTGWFVKSTAEFQTTVREHKEKMAAIDETNLSDADKKEKRREVNHNTLKVGFKKFVGPTACVIAGEVAQGFGYGTEKSEHAQTATALASSIAMLETIRSKVIADSGEDKWREYAYGQQMTETTVVDMQNGEVKTETKLEMGTEHNGPFSYLFYEPNRCYSESKGSNRRFLQLKRTQFQNELDDKGVVFLRDVITEIGGDMFVDCPEATAKAGWVKARGDAPAVTISFGLESNDEATKRFMTDMENSVLLEFNCVPNVYEVMRNMK